MYNNIQTEYHQPGPQYYEINSSVDYDIEIHYEFRFNFIFVVYKM